jgi:hypothetical protein
MTNNISNSIQSINTGADTMSNDADNIFAPITLDGLTLSRIASSYMLCSLSISIWSATINDRNADAQIEQANNTGGKAGRFMKNLMTENKILRELRALSSTARARHNTLATAAWNLNGDRVIHNSLVPAFMTEFRQRQADFYAMAEDFYKDYDTAISAEAFRLGSLFNRDDYPTEAALRRKFSFDFSLIPMPQAGHFSTDAEQELINQLTEQFNSTMHKRVNAAINSMWQRLHAALNNIVRKVTPEYDAAGNEKSKRFHDSFIGNAEELAGILRACNIANDPKFDEATRDFERLVLGIDVNDLKKHKDARKDLREKAQAVMDKFNLTSLSDDADSLGW